MSHRRPVVVECSEGFREQPFSSRDVAERWVENFTRAQARDSRLCQGTHTVREEHRERQAEEEPGSSPIRA